MKSLLQPSIYRTIFFIWLGWAIVLLGYQVMMPARLDLAKPDYALQWTPNETSDGSQADKIYLNEPFLNSHVSWDSEFYLAIATEGYDSDNVRTVPGVVKESDTIANFWPFALPEPAKHGVPPSMSYAFFPFYPLTMWAFNLPFSLLGMNPIATSALSGVVVSLLATLAGMLALYELAKDELGEEGGLRAAFYLVIFPSGFFLAQIYTEGLFIGLAFWSLVMMRRGRLGWAAALAIAATFTRALGGALVVPLALAWFKTGEWKLFTTGKITWKAVGNALLVASPVIAFLIWKVSYYGLAFSEVERVWFGRGLLEIENTIATWSVALATLTGSNSQAAAYYALEFAAIVLGFAACIIGFRRHPDLALFGFLVVFLSFTSGSAQGMHRYILAAPPVFILLADWGKNKAFDRTWTLASVLLMGMMATLFTFDMWTG